MIFDNETKIAVYVMIFGSGLLAFVILLYLHLY